CFAAPGGKSAPSSKNRTPSFATAEIYCDILIMTAAASTYIAVADAGSQMVGSTASNCKTQIARIPSHDWRIALLIYRTKNTTPAATYLSCTPSRRLIFIQ